MGFLDQALREKFEENKPDELQANIRMISGCEDVQCSADVQDVGSFQLPDPAGRAGGACTSMLLNVLYKDHQTPEEALSFVEVLQAMRENLEADGYDQIPQLTASKPIDVNEPFDLVPPEATGTKRALLIGINYVGQCGELSGCHNDVLNMIEYLKDVHGFEDDNIKVLMDDGEHDEPTRENILQAYEDIVEAAEAGDALFCHYSGHGGNVPDDDEGEEEDGYDETLCPVDYAEAGDIRDDKLYEILIRPLPKDVHLTCLMDCCHSGTVLDLPYEFKADGNFDQMEIDEKFDFANFFEKYNVSNILEE